MTYQRSELVVKHGQLTPLHQHNHRRWHRHPPVARVEPIILNTIIRKVKGTNSVQHA